MKIFCEDFKMQFEEYCDGELTAEMRDACDAHIKECPRCHAFYYDHRRVDEMLLMLPREAAPEGFAERVMARWREEQADAPPSLIARVRQFFQSPRLVFLSEVAALAILVVGAFYFYNFNQPGNSAAVNDPMNGMANLPRPTATPAAGVLSNDDKAHLANLANDHSGIANTIGPDALIEMAGQNSATGDNAAIAVAVTPTQDELIIPESLMSRPNALAALSNFDQYFAAVSSGASTPHLLRNQPGELYSWGMGHDIKKGMRDAEAAIDAPAATAAPRIMLHKVYRAADYTGQAGINMTRDVTALFARHDGRMVRSATQAEVQGDTVLQYAGWIPQESYQAFQAEFVKWQPTASAAASLDVPGVTDTPAEPAAVMPASAVNVTVVFTFHK